MSGWVRSPVRSVPEDWIDYNGHMNLAYYVMAFDHDLDDLLDREIGAGPSFSKSHNQGPFALQNHVHYLDELLQGEAFYCKFLMLDGDAKRVHIAGSMHRASDDTPVCVMEQVLINVDHESRRSAPYPQDIQDRISAMVAAHTEIERPPQIGRPIGLKRT
ncbi:thioesterase family protein [Halocynthiibacter styelae]|uniref:Thioesterase family protein n=1 Tax=Halocynthiibacter styelae TaxID=2761955 RepID=A0A8J7LL03_9RHOB|nr:thioesterase family protein [Paenihalocynthiibacter styelae]MBI1495005.1 thioesterase family protein [Paenihalocynthiibacter styelae]